MGTLPGNGQELTPLNIEIIQKLITLSASPSEDLKGKIGSCCLKLLKRLVN